MRLAGRDRELQRVEAFVGATGQDARGLLIRGEAGIGKSAIWRVALDRFRAAGHCVLVTRPAEEELQGSMVGLLDLFETIETEPSVLDPDADVFDRGRAILRTLRRLMASRPTVLAIDDLQWLDPISVRSLRYALRRLEDQPVAVLATERSGPGEPPGPLLLPPERTEELTVGALSIEAIRLVIAPVLGAIPRPALDLIQQMSAGNPMYALELARTTDPRGNRLTTARRDTLRGILSARLAATPPDVLDLLRTAAALGPAPSGRLMAACGGPEDGPQLAAAVELGLLTVDESFIVRFTHPLLASVVLGQITPAARREIHSRLAEFVAEPDDRARHLALSTIEPDADVAAELDAAADRANRRGAPGLAAELIAHARLISAAGDTVGRERRELTEIALRAAAGETARALALVDGALTRLPPGRHRLDMLSLRVYLDTARSDAFLEAALAEAGEDELQRARVLSMQAWIAGISGGRLDDAIRLSEHVLDTARSHGDTDLEMLAAVTLSTSALLAGRPRRDVLTAAVAVAERRGGPRLGAWPQVFHGRQCLWDGQLGEARRRFDEMRAVFARAGTEFQRPYRMYDLALADIAAGDLTRAAELVDDGLDAAGDAHNEQARAWLAYPEGLVHAHLGASDRALHAADLLATWGRERDEPPRVLSAHHVRGVVALAEGDLDKAVPELGAGVELAARIGYRHPGAIPVLPDAIEAVARTGDDERATAMVDELHEQAAALAAPWIDAAATRARGITASARDVPSALEAFGAAAEAFASLGYQLDAARTRLTLGRALVTSGRRTSAAEVLAAARDRFRSLGATPWERQAAEELERVAPGRTTGTLTDTEARIVALVAGGRRNREVAAELFVSVATVEAHLTRIYRKLGVRSRTELSRRALESFE